MQRLDITKTYKLFVGGAFPRSESGRSWPVRGAGGTILAHLCLASRKDLRDAVEVARAGQAKWAAASAYNRGQVLYRLAEMMEGKRDELAAALRDVVPAGTNGATKAKARAPKTAGTALSPEREVACAIDRVVHYAGWTDKITQVLGCANPVAGPYFNFTIPEATGVVAVVAPDDAPLLGLVSLALPALAGGNAVIAIPSERNPLASMVLAEGLATSDLPAGAMNILTGLRSELLPHFASHRDLDAIVACVASEAERSLLRAGIAENLKRVSIIDAPKAGWHDASAQGVSYLEATLEHKTVWHPALA